jgi:hypothetical protein
MHLSCTETNTFSKRIEMRFYTTHVTQEFHQVRPKWFLKLRYIWCKLWTYLAPIQTLYPNGPKRDYDPHHLGVPSGASKKISELTVRLAQTVHLSLVKISSISKRTETSFRLSLVTLEYHPVRTNRFLGLWYIWCKPCSYLALKLTLSPNGPKQASI